MSLTGTTTVSRSSPPLVLSTPLPGRWGKNSAALSRVVDSIHLNPVRAKVIEPALLISFRPSSLPHFFPTQALSPRRSPSRLDLGAVPLSGHRNRLLARAAFAIGSADLGRRLLTRQLRRAQAALKFRAQLSPRSLAIRSLRTLALAPHLDSRWPVFHAHRAAGFVDLLPAGAGAAHKSLLHVGRQDAEGIEPLLNLSW